MPSPTSQGAYEYHTDTASCLLKAQEFESRYFYFPLRAVSVKRRRSAADLKVINKCIGSCRANVHLPLIRQTVVLKEEGCFLSQSTAAGS